MSDEEEISALSVFGGFLLGVGICFGITVISLFLIGGSWPEKHYWVFPVFNAVVNIIIGALALRSFHSSGVARGIVIAMALGLLLNGICGVTAMR